MEKDILAIHRLLMDEKTKNCLILWITPIHSITNNFFIIFFFDIFFIFQDFYCSFKYFLRYALQILTILRINLMRSLK